MNKLLFTFLFLTFGAAWGGVYEDGDAAFGRGDSVTAVKLWRPLAEQGDVSAQFGLGHMYDGGQGVLQDYKEAVKWYRLAAEQGHANAQANLGVMYHYGYGVPRDYSRAHMWFNLASAAGEATATEDRDIIAKKMTPQQIEKAQEMAKACQARNLKGC